MASTGQATAESVLSRKDVVDYEREVREIARSVVQIETALLDAWEMSHGDVLGLLGRLKVHHKRLRQKVMRLRARRRMAGLRPDVQLTLEPLGARCRAFI